MQRVDGANQTYLHRDGTVPLHRQLAALLRARIVHHREWSAGKAIPSEHELMRSYSVSRATVRRALEQLEREGLLERVRGKGTFVRVPKFEQSLFRFYSLGREAPSRGYALESRLLKQRTARLPARVAALLGSSEGTEAVEIVRLRIMEGEPLAVERSLIPAALCPPMATADLEQRSLYDILSEYGLTVARAEEWLEPITAGAFAARHLGVARGAPAFRVERVCYDASQRPLEFRESVIRGDRYRFHVELTR